MNKAAIVAGMEVTRGLSNIDFVSTRLTLLQPLLSTQSDSNKNQKWPNMALFPQVISL